MEIAINITDDIKRAMRYLGYSKADIRAEIEHQCSDILENLVRRAKREWVEKKTIGTIFPEPLTE